MSTSDNTRPLMLRPTSAALLVLLATAAWSLNWWQQSRIAPIRTHIEAGVRYLQQGQGTAAEGEWKAAVRLDSSNVEAWELLGDYYIALENWVEARAALGHVLELRPETPQIHYRLAQCAAQVDDMKMAQREATAELKRNPNHVESLEILATALAREDTDIARLKILRHLVELRPQSTEHLAQLGSALVNEKDYVHARPVIEALLQLEPNSGPAHAMHGITLLYTDPSPQGLNLATTELKKALAQNPSDVVARLFLGRVYLRLKRPHEAIFYLQKLDTLATAHKSYLFELARAHQMLGNVQQAQTIRRRYAANEQRDIQIKRLNSRISNNPRDFEAILSVGLLLLGSEKPVGADGNINEAARMRPTDPRVKAAQRQLEALYVRHLQLGLAALQRRNYDQVGRQFSQVVMLRPHDERTAKAMQQFQAAIAHRVPASATPPQFTPKLGQFAP